MYLLALFNMQGNDEHCKSFKWLDGIPCRRGAETAPIVIAKFTRLEAEAAMAKNNEMEARAMIASLLHRERVAKCSAEKARVSLRMANAQACKYQIALLMSWLAFVVLFIFSLGDYGKCVCHDFEFGLVVCVMKFYHVVGHENVL